jgi:hypothetical protein
LLSVENVFGKYVRVNENSHLDAVFFL